MQAAWGKGVICARCLLCLYQVRGYGPLNVNQLYHLYRLVPQRTVYVQPSYAHRQEELRFFVFLDSATCWLDKEQMVMTHLLLPSVVMMTSSN